MSDKVYRDMLSQLCSDMLYSTLSNEKMIQLIEERMQPLKSEIERLTDENRRMKISLSFLESELKDATSYKKSMVSECKDAETQVDESNFLELEPEDKADEIGDVPASEKLVNGHLENSLKRTINDYQQQVNGLRKRPALQQTSPTSITDRWTGSVPPRTMETRTTARKSTSSLATNLQNNKQTSSSQQASTSVTVVSRSQPAVIAPKAINSTVIQLQTGTSGTAQAVNVDASVLTGLQNGSLILVNQNGKIIAQPAATASATVGNLIIRPTVAPAVTVASVAANKPAAAPTTTVQSVDKNVWESFLNLKNQQKQQPHTYTRTPAVGNNVNLMALISGASNGTSTSSNAGKSFAPIAPKPPAASSVTISTVNKTPLASSNNNNMIQRTDPSTLSICTVPSAAPNAVASSSSSRDDDEEMDVEEVQRPRPATPDVVDLSDDDEGEEKESTPLEQEISLAHPDCCHHPIHCPTLPFAVLESILPHPRLSVRMGTSRDNKKAVILRMESAVDSSKCQGYLQYRVFSYFQNEKEVKEERKWKQLTCIKVKCGKICECTLTQLVINARYHFVVCLVNGNNRSRFSNCATTQFS